MRTSTPCQVNPYLCARAHMRSRVCACACVRASYGLPSYSLFPSLLHPHRDHCRHHHQTAGVCPPGFTDYAYNIVGSISTHGGLGNPQSLTSVSCANLCTSNSNCGALEFNESPGLLMYPCYLTSGPNNNGPQAAGWISCIRDKFTALSAMNLPVAGGAIVTITGITLGFADNTQTVSYTNTEPHTC